MALTVLLTLSVILASFAGSSGSSDSNYMYDDQKDWPKTCVGKRQSPISLPDICNPSKVNNITIDSSMKYDFLHYNQLLPLNETKFVNNGHTVELQVEKFEKQIVQIAPSIQVLAAGKNNVYQFYQLHFHWAFNQTRGSEHLIAGSRKALEMQLVHYNKKYPNADEANKQPDGVSVLGVLFSEDTDVNPSLNPIIDQIKLIRKNNQSTTAAKTFSLQSLLPLDTSFFYMYPGSLTTPPCTESVTWLIVAEVQRFGYSQLKEFQKVENPVARDRMIQERNGRPVYANSNVFCDIDSKTRAVRYRG